MKNTIVLVFTAFITGFSALYSQENLVTPRSFDTIVTFLRSSWNNAVTQAQSQGLIAQSTLAKDIFAPHDTDIKELGYKTDKGLAIRYSTDGTYPLEIITPQGSIDLAGFMNPSKKGSFVILDGNFRKMVQLKLEKIPGYPNFYAIISLKEKMLSEKPTRITSEIFGDPYVASDAAQYSNLAPRVIEP